MDGIIDEKDRRILALLQKNAHVTTKELAKLSGFRPSTVHARVSRLRKSGVIKSYTIIVDDKKVGRDFVAFIFLTTKKNLPDTFFHNPNIREVFGITGEYDLLLKTKFPSVNEFNTFLLELRKNTCVEKTFTIVGTLNIKEEL
jgi:DNA-binding Lrp family transcriptional regulator